VQVEPADIAGARPCSLNNCVLARALRHTLAFQGVTHVHVGRQQTHVFLASGKVLVFGTDPASRRATETLDREHYWPDPPFTTYVFRAPVRRQITQEQREATRRYDAGRRAKRAVQCKERLPYRRVITLVD
jgi:hypothetical protein